jgi:hypothetical protein
VLANSPLQYTWTRKSGTPFTLDRATSASRDLFIPASTLKAGAQYEFVLRVSYKNYPHIYGESIALVNVVSSPVIARIRGGDRLFTLGHGALVLDASDSVDLDNSNTPLVYSWTCWDTVNNQACWAASEASRIVTTQAALIVPSTVLTISIYQFNVSVSKGDAEPSTASVVISTAGNGPSVTIQVSSKRFS